MSCGAADTNNTEMEHRRQANQALAVSAAGLALTGIVELILAVLTGSVALLGDSLHNLSDVSTSAVVFLGFRISGRPASRRYPYGFERAEDLAGLGVALVIWASAAFAGFESYQKLVSASPTTNVGIGMVGAAMGIVGNQLVARYKRIIGERIHSATLLADAKHSWLDALSSFGALVGLALVAAGYPWGDPVAGFAVTLFVAHVGFEVTKEILGHLMDSVEPEDLLAAESAALAVPGVAEATAKGRWSGRSLVVEIEGIVQSELSLLQAEAIGHEVQHAVLKHVGNARHVLWIPRSDANRHGRVTEPSRM